MLTESGKRFLFFTAIIFLIALLLYATRRVLTPFMVAFALAYLLDPWVDQLEEHRVPRTTAVVGLMGSFFALLLLGCALLLPMLQVQVEKLARDVPKYIRVFEANLTPWVARLSDVEPQKIQEILRVGLEKFGSLPLKIVSSATAFLWSSLSGIVDILFMAINLAIIPVAMFYLLRDYDEIVRKVLELVPPRFQKKVREIGFEIDRVLANFIRGQLIVASFMAGLYSIGLFFCGTPLSLVIGISAGFANLVPYLGLLFGFIPAAILTYLHFQEFLPLLGVVAVFTVVQALEGMLITPRIVGDQIGLHPVMIMIALLIGADFFGLFGILLGVPAAAVINVLIKRGLIQYKESKFFS